MSLTDDEASQLLELGKTLASKLSWWGELDDEASEASSGSVIRCTPRTTGDWSVTFDNVIGLVGLGSSSFIVRPKIPMTHALYILERGGLIPRLADLPISVAIGNDFLDLISRWFLNATSLVLARDLIKNYEVAHDLVSAVRGQLDNLQTAQRFYSGALDFACTFDDFTSDNALNRILFAALTVIRSSQIVSLDVRQQAVQLIGAFAGISELRRADLQIEIDRRTHYYSDALSLAKLIITSLSINHQFGTQRGSTFLFRTPEAIEAGLRAVLEAGLAPMINVRKYSSALSPSTMRVDPDLRFDPSGAVGDCKYKIYDDGWIRSDLYQIVAFAAAGRTKKTCVVAFAKPGQPSPATVRFGDIEAKCFLWDTLLEPKTAAQNLVDECTEWLGAPSTDMAQATRDARLKYRDLDGKPIDLADLETEHETYKTMLAP